MKHIFRLLVILLTTITLAGCDAHQALTSNKKSAQGAPYELLVICNAPEWEGEVGVSLRTLLEEPVEMLNQVEPQFNVLRITSRDFKSLLVDHRNILKVIVNPKVEKASISAQYDVSSSPQIVLTFQAPSQAAMVEYLKQNGEQLVQVLNLAERERTVRAAERHSVKVLNDIIASKFGADMRVPKGYDLRVNGDNFLWASHEYPVASQGFFIYTYPYKGSKSLSLESLVAMRNLFAGRIPGPSDGSYMTTVEQIPDAEGRFYTPFRPSYKVVTINNRQWIEMRGFWEVAGDFMGGPFVSYTTINKAKNEVFTIDGYVYSPKSDKRNMVRALEHLPYLINFPTVDEQK